MGKKGRKTRWRKLPIPIGPQGGEEGEEGTDKEEREQPPSHHPRVTFNEDEYTKITTPRQDMLFKKGYLSKKRSTPSQQQQDTADSQSADSVESEQYICEEHVPQYVYPPPAGYIDHTGVYFLNSNAYEVYDPYTGNVTVIVGPAGYGGGQPVLAAVPCQPVPLQHVEWFNPAPPQCSPQSRKKPSSTDSQNCSAQSSESTCPPSSPQEPLEDAPGIVYPPQYIYPGYMFGAPIYNMNGVSVQSVVPPNVLPADTKQRRKKRRRRRRGGVTEEGSESSGEEQLSCEAGAESQSGASSDAGPGSSSSKTNSDSGIHMDPNPSGSNSPQLQNSEDRLGDFQAQTELYSSSTEEARLKADSGGAVSPISRSCSSSTETAPENSLLAPDAASSERDIPHSESPLTETSNPEETNDSDDVAPEPVNEQTVQRDKYQVEALSTEAVEDETQIGEPDDDRLGYVREAIEIPEKPDEGPKRKVDSIPRSGDKPRPVTGSVDRLASALAEAIVEKSIRESLRRRSKRPKRLPITEAVTKWLESQGGSALSCIDTESEDEGIDEDGEGSLITGQKNVDGNPFPVLSLSGSGTRVADDCASVVSSAGEWDLYDGLELKCDPVISVDKYYRLAQDSPRHAKFMETAVHFHRAGPFPCGVCCLIQ